MWKRLLVVAVLAVSSCAMGQSTPKEQPPEPPPSNPAPPRSEPAPRGPNDSSSRDDNDNTFPESAEPQPPPDDSVTELHSWDPHKALKDVEVGDFYYKRENYRAALGRFCEALTYKPNDAVATLRVAETLDKVGDLVGARSYYEAYLKILPQGPAAGQSKKALERIKSVPQPADKNLAQKLGCEPLGKPIQSREAIDPDRPVLTRAPTSPASGKSQ